MSSLRRRSSSMPRQSTSSWSVSARRSTRRRHKSHEPTRAYARPTPRQDVVQTAMNIDLKLKVEDLNACYVQAIDDDKLEAWPDFFIEHGCYRVTTAENFERGLPLAMI